MLRILSSIKQKLSRTIKCAIFLWIVFVLSAIISPGLIFAADESGPQALYNSRGKRDPFVPLVTLTSKEPTGLLGLQSADEVSLEGVVYDPNGESMALINGSLMKQGQEFGNIKVVQVKADGVIVSVNGMEAFKPLYTEKDEAGPKIEEKKKVNAAQNKKK